MKNIKMDELQDLVRVLKRLHRHGQFPVYDHMPNLSKSGLVKDRIILALQNNEFATDEEGAALLDASLTSFRMMKSRTKKRLYLSLLVWPLERSKTPMVESECLAYFSRARLLISLKEFALAEKQLYHATKLARAEENSEMILLCLRLRRSLFINYGRPYALKKVLAEIKKWERIHEMEEEAASLYAVQKTYITKSSYSRIFNIQKTPAVLEQIALIKKQSNSSRVAKMLFDLQLTYYIYVEDYHAALTLAGDLAGQLQKNNQSEKIDEGFAYRSLAVANFRTRNYKQALAFAKQAEGYSQPQDAETLPFYEIFFACALRMADYELAGSVATRAMEIGKSLGKAEEVFSWEISQLYLQLLSAQSPVKKLNEPLEIKNKAVQVKLYMIQILHLLFADKMDDFFKLYLAKVPFIKQFKSVPPRETARLKAFIGFIELLISKAFNIDEVELKASPHLARLQSTFDPYSPTEIIPFDDLIRSLLEKLRADKAEVVFGK